MLKKITLLLIFILPGVVVAQQSFTRSLDSFDKIIVSPHINLVLTEGSQEEAEVEFYNIDEMKINVVVKGETLHIYLDDARYIEKNKKEKYGYYSSGIYQGAEVTAYVTYQHLKALEVRGEEDVRIESPLDSEDFILTLYGSSSVVLRDLNAENFRVTSYGENDLTVESGKVHFQRYILYGASHIDVSGLTSFHAKTKIYGESQLTLHASDALDISAFGEPIITFSGNPQVNKNLMIGEAKLFKVN
jgi:hypothetical protein